MSQRDSASSWEPQYEYSAGHVALPTAVGAVGTGFGQACEVASRVDNVMVCHSLFLIGIIWFVQVGEAFSDSPQPKKRVLELGCAPKTSAFRHVR